MKERLMWKLVWRAFNTFHDLIGIQLKVKLAGMREKKLEPIVSRQSMSLI